MTARAGIVAALTVVPMGLAGQSLQDRIDRTPWGDTLFVPPGVYHECVTLTRPIVLLAARDVTIRGACRASVVTITAPATIKGFTIEGSGTDLSREHAGIWAERADSLVVEDNHLRDVLFGIYVKESVHPIVRGNAIEGKDVPITERGDAIRFWYSRGARIEDNRVARARDLVIWFSDSAVVRHNTIDDSRYGLHYMYSHHSRFEHNQFRRNEVGAFLMYSTHITFRNNTFAYARGLFGKGLGFKDAEYIDASGNTIVKNAVGLYLDNSPASAGAVNRFARNTVAYNDVGVAILPSVRNNEFTESDFLHNSRPVAVSGGGTATGNRWIGNHWTEYAGFDADHDGTGDTPFEFARWSDDLFDRYDDLQLFALSPAARTADVLTRIIPSLRPTPVVVDSQPRIRRVLPTPRSEIPTPWFPASVSFMAAAMAGFLSFRHRRAGVQS